MNAPTLFDKTVQQKFFEFHEANPHVYNLLVRFAREVKARGKNRTSIALLFNRARWEVQFSTTDPEFKIRNDFMPHYARMIMACNDDLDGLFETRRIWKP